MALFDLGGGAAIVAGGNGGIGFGMAQGLAEAGAAIVIAGRDEAKSAAAVKKLAAAGATAEAVAVDVTAAESCRALIKAAVKKFGRLDILVNNPGTNIRKQPEEYALEEWNMIIATNLTSPFPSAQAPYPPIPHAF